MNHKIVSRKKLVGIIEASRKLNKKIVFTNGCFDILHVGHVKYLQKAKSLADILIVGINCDVSVRKLKGESRPIITEKERAEVVSALECVDYVTIFHELTPENLIRIIKPDIHVKGGDWEVEQLPEASLVQSYGGRIVIADEVRGHSTSDIIRKIVEKYRV